MTNAMNSGAMALSAAIPEVSEPVQADAVADAVAGGDAGARIAAGARLADVLHPSMLATGGSLAEADPSYIQVTIDFAESEIAVPGRAEFLADISGSRLEDTETGGLGLVTRAEAEDVLLTTGLRGGDDRRLGDSLEGAGLSAAGEAAEVDPAGLGLEEYEDAAVARSETHLVNRVRDRATVGGAFSGSPSDGSAPDRPAAGATRKSEPFNSADVFRELAESNSVRETLQRLDNPAATPAAATPARDEVLDAPFQSLAEADVPQSARGSLPVPADTVSAGPRPEDVDDGILMLDEVDDPELDLVRDAAELDAPDAPDEGPAPEPQVSFAEPIDWSALDTGPDEEAYDLGVTAADTEMAMSGDSDDDPFAAAPLSVTPEQDFAELGFHHNFIIGDFSSDRGAESDAIELDLSGLDFDEEGVAG